MLSRPDRRACIIGAGSSGITAAQVLDARGIPFDCFEMGSGVGGNWRYDNDNGVSSAYRSLHINTSRHAMEYAAYPMPETLPDYPSHWQIADYFDAYVDHFGLRERITLPHRGGEGRARRGRRVRRDRRARWTTSPRGRGPPLHRRAGRQRPPLGPALAGARLPGSRDLHRRAGARPLLPHARPARGQARGGARHRQLRHRHRRRVLAGRAGDLPRDAARRAHRAEVHVRQADRPPHRLAARPGTVRGCSRRPWRRCCGCRSARSPTTGCPSPTTTSSTRTRPSATTCSPGSATATSPSSRTIDRFEGTQGLLHRRQRRSRPTSSSTAPATRSPSRSSPRRSCAPTTTTSTSTGGWSRPDHPGLYFIGLVQPLGAIMPLAEEQAHWVADLIAGDGRPPAGDRDAGPDRGVRRRRCGVATSPRSGTPSRSTSTSTAPSSARNA